MTLKTYSVISMFALMAVAIWLWMGPMGIFIALAALFSGYIVYTIGRFVWAVIERLERR